LEQTPTEPEVTLITLDDLTVEEPAPEPARPGGDLSQYMRWGLALLSLGAAGIHFAVTGLHFGETWYHGTFFALVAWLQLIWAVALMVKPSRRLLLAGIIGNLAVAEVWLVSRTIGIPFGPNSGTAEAVGFVDVLTTVFEAAIVLGAVALLRPTLGERPVRAAGGLAAVGVVGAAVIALSTYSLTPTFASSHHHGAGEVASGAGNEAAAGHSHGGAGDAAAPAGHTHGAGGTAGAVPVSAGGFAPGASPCEKSGPAASEGQVMDAEGHNHRGPAVQEAMDFGTRQQLAQEQLAARAVVLRFPDVASAEKAGYKKSTPYVPCIGAHYTNTALAAKFDINAPSELLFDGTTPDAKIVGLSYLVYHPGGAPEGFAGPNDRWHGHTFNGGLCINPQGVVVGAESTSPEQCKARGGAKVPLKDIWMLHDWVVPGWDCSWGVFASECPELGGRVGRTAWTNNGA
jgi:hypothetical protein